MSQGPRIINIYLGTVLLITDHDHIAKRKAAGDTDASNDVIATLTRHSLEVTSKDDYEAMMQLASELKSMADSVVYNARRLK